MIQIRTLHLNELPAWFDLVTAVFGVPRAYFERHWSNDPWKDLNGIRVAVDEGQLVATVRVFRRRLWLGGVSVETGGVGEVCTRPEYRGRGLSGALLEDALRFMTEQHMALSLLFSGLHEHYGRYGWSVAPLELGVTMVEPGGAGPYEVRQVEPADRAELALLYEQFAPRFDGPLVRSPEYWASWWEAEQHNTWVARSDGTLVGYVSLRQRSTGDLQVDDFAAAPGPDTGALLRDLAGAAVAAGGTAQRRIYYPLAAFPGLEPLERAVVTGAMYRVVCPDALCSEAARAFDRLRGVQVDRHVWWPVDGF